MQLNDNTAALRNLSALVDFSNLVNSSLDLNFTLNNLILTCFTKFHTTKGLIALIDSNGIVSIESSKGIQAEKLEKFPKVEYEKIFDHPEFRLFLEENKFVLAEKIISFNGPKGIILLGERLTKNNYEIEDINFLKTILNLGATAIENSLVFEELRVVNRDLDSKVNQLSSLFDLSKEFSGILEVNMVVKMLVYSLLGQLLVTKYAVLTIKDDATFNILESKFSEDDLRNVFANIKIPDINKPLTKSEFTDDYSKLINYGIEVIIPMQIKGEVKGLIILGARRNNLNYAKSDLEYISSVGSLAIISIENARLFNETLEKQKLEKDLEIARKIQKNLLPSKIPQPKNFEIAAFNQSAKQVGGDYFDVVKLDENRTLVAIGDVSGKGVQAALLMANLQAFLKSICKQNISLEAASNLINDLVSENTTGGSFITFFWAILDDEKRSITSVNMGHNPPLLIRDGVITKLKKGGMILGVMETMLPYVSETHELKPGDTLIAFTDGITEAMNINDEEFTDEKLEQDVLNYYSLSAQQILDKIYDDVRKFTKGAEQSDDITLTIIKTR